MAASADDWSSGAYAPYDEESAQATGLEDAETYAYDPNSAYYNTTYSDEYASYEQQQQQWYTTEIREGGEYADQEYDYGAYDQAAVGTEYATDATYDATTSWSDPNAYTYGTASGENPEGSYFELDGADPSVPTSPFGDEAYWQQYGEAGDATEPPGEGYVDDQQTQAVPDGAHVSASALEMSQSIATPEIATSESSLAGATPPSSSPGKSRTKKNKVKTKQERMEKRQQALEKGEQDEIGNQDTPFPEGDVKEQAKSPAASVVKQPATRASTRPPTFLERERAKVRLQMRKARAIARKRMPVQVRILTETRKRLSPLEIYFGGSMEAALSDVFWASMKGDLGRVQFLIEIEHVDVNDCQFDPWHMDQTPLHWAAKGGHVGVVQYLLQAGANPRSLDETGSLPLHLACWAGHIDSTLALLRATDTKDLYVQDYDAGLASLDWAHLRGHTKLVKAIERYEDGLWLPKFVDDLIRGIIRYKIKLFRDTPKPAKSPTRGLNFRRGGANSSNPSAATSPPPATAPLPAQGNDVGPATTSTPSAQTIDSSPPEPSKQAP